MGSPMSGFPESPINVWDRDFQSGILGFERFCVMALSDTLERGNMR